MSKVLTSHRKKCPRVVHFNVPRNWFERNSRDQKHYSEGGKKISWVSRSTGKSSILFLSKHHPWFAGLLSATGGEVPTVPEQVKYDSDKTRNENERRKTKMTVRILLSKLWENEKNENRSSNSIFNLAGKWKTKIDYFRTPLSCEVGKFEFRFGISEENGWH